MLQLENFVRLRRIASRVLAVLLFAGTAGVLHAGSEGSQQRARHATALAELNDGPCAEGQAYKQEDLREPTQIVPHDRRIETELIVRMRKRCVPVWVPSADEKSGSWQMQTLSLRTYGFPKDPNRRLTEADANDPDSDHIAWSAPGPTFVMHPASKPGAPDGTRFKARLYNRMPWDPTPAACQENFKCNTHGDNPGADPATGQCKAPIDPKLGGVLPETPSQIVNGRVVEPPNCFHGPNSTNLHFHGFHVSPAPGQDDVDLEIRPPAPATETAPAAGDDHGAHGAGSPVAYGHFDYDIDPLRFTQAPGTHWYHAHKHGSTAIQVLNGQIGTMLVRGEFDATLEEYFEKKGGGKLVDRVLVVQQLQEKQPGLGGADQVGAVLVNGQGNPIVRMKRGEIQRWRFVGATMQASAALRIGFPDIEGKDAPEVRQIAMDGVQFSPENYACQPFLNNPDCTPVPDHSAFDEITAFKLDPGNRVDVLVKAPDTPGTHCLVLDITSTLAGTHRAEKALAARADAATGTCGATNKLGPLFTLVIEDDQKAMTFPAAADFPALPGYLTDIPAVTDPALKRTVFYQMVGAFNLTPGSGRGFGGGSQFWISQAKYAPGCANETVTMDVPEQWTLRNNSAVVAHPFHIHQNPFQLVSETGRGTYKYPVWRDVIAIPTATPPAGTRLAQLEPNSDPDDPKTPWGSAVINYVAKEFAGGFVNHCHILGHEDRGMMHNTQAVCANGQGATTGTVAPGAVCDAQGFCPSDCVTGTPVAAVPQCEASPDQRSNWPEAFGYPPPAAQPKPKPQGGGGGLPQATR